MKKDNRPYWERRVDGTTDPRLRGLAHSGALNRQRGLKGSTLGPANAGRRLTKEEREAAIQKLRDEGKL